MPDMSGRRRGRSQLWGRAESIRAVADTVLTWSGRLTSVTGRGGVGKTTLALAVADVLERDHGFRVIEIPLEGVGSADLVPDVIGRAVGVLADGSGPVLEAVAERLAGTASVLLLDNFEHVLAASSVVEQLLAATSDLRVLVTSQAALRLVEERVCRLEPLAVPDVGEVTAVGALASAAVRLYAERAAGVEPGFVIDERNAAAVAELCRRLDGLPLAIELAAARVPVLPPGELLRRIEHGSLDLLRRPGAASSARRHDLRAAVGWTVSLLGADEQALFDRLSVVAGTFDVDTAIALAEHERTAIDDLQSLVEVHLVVPAVGRSEVRFRMPSAIREVAAERLAASGAAEEVRRRHLRATGAWCRAAWRARIGAAPAWRPAAIEDRVEDLLACVTAALDLGEVTTAVDVLNALLALWDAQGYSMTSEELADRVLRAAEESEEASIHHASARAMSGLLALQHGVHDVDRARFERRMAEAEAMARRLGDAEVLLEVLACRMLTAVFAGQVDAALGPAAEGLERAQAVRSPRYLPRFEVWNGMLAHVLGDFPRAVELGLSALERGRAANDAELVVLCALLLRPMLGRYPDMDAVVPTVDEALALARSVRERTLVSLLAYAAVYDAVAAGDLVRARGLVVQCLVHAESASRTMALYALVSATAVFHVAGDHERVAWLSGVLQPFMGAVEVTVPPVVLRHHQGALAAAREALGGAAFDGANRRGLATTWLAAVRASRSALETADEPVATTTVVADEPLVRLTPRQREVLRLVARGNTNRQIATALGLTPKTVMHHLAAIYLALGVQGRGEAAAWAFRQGLVD